MTQDNKVEALEAYAKAMREVSRAAEIYDRLCEETFGKDAGTYRHKTEYYTPEIIAAYKAYAAASKELARAAQEYCDANNYR